MSRKLTFFKKLKKASIAFAQYVIETWFFRHEEYQVLISELYQPVKSFDEKHMYICETYHKHLYKYSISIILQ